MEEFSELSKLADSKVASRLYEDAVAPMARQLGLLGEQTVKVIRLGLAPLQWTAAIQDKLDARLTEICVSVPEERHAQAPIWFSGAAAKNIHLLLDDTGLQTMFSNLLKCAIDRERQEGVHPGFVNVIAALSPIDARFLSELSSVEPIEEKLSRGGDDTIRELIRRRIPTMNDLSSTAIEATIDNLSGLSVVNYSVHYVVDVDSASHKHVVLKLTQYGRNFCAACLPESCDDEDGR